MWEKIIGKLAPVGHDDPARMTDTDIIASKDAMIAGSLAPTTISSNPGVDKGLFRWAAINKKIAANPAAHVE